MREIFKISASLFFGILIVIFIEFFLNLEIFQLIVAEKLFYFLSLFFDNISKKGFFIYIDNINFIITSDCVKLTTFFLLFPFVLASRKIKLLLILFFLLYIQNFFRIVFEIFLFINFGETFDMFFSNFQNIFQPITIYFILIFAYLFNYYRRFKLGYKGIFFFF